jgi:hypothetical protein
MPLNTIHVYASFLQEDLLNPESFDVTKASFYVTEILEYIDAIHAIMDAGLDCKNKPKP